MPDTTSTSSHASVEFAGRHVVVSGGTGALGSAVVGRLLAAGARVSIPVFNERELATFALKDHPSVRTLAGFDLSDEAQVERFYGEAVAPVGSLWASVHVAGGFAMAPVEEAGAAVFQRMMAMNAASSYLCTREAIRRMRATGLSGGTGGRVVNVSALAALEADGGAKMAAYVASKAAVAALTRAIGCEVKGEGILVNAIAPSVMDTPQNRAGMPDADHSKWPACDEVACTICFLASPGNRVTRGAVVPVGGRS